MPCFKTVYMNRMRDPIYETCQLLWFRSPMTISTIKTRVGCREFLLFVLIAVNFPSNSFDRAALQFIFFNSWHRFFIFLYMIVPITFVCYNLSFHNTTTWLLQLEINGVHFQRNSKQKLFTSLGFIHRTHIHQTHPLALETNLQLYKTY